MKALQKGVQSQSKHCKNNIHKVKPQRELSRKGLVLSRQQKTGKNKVSSENHKSLQEKKKKTVFKGRKHTISFVNLHQQIARMILAGRKKKFTKESCVRMPLDKLGQFLFLFFFSNFWLISIYFSFQTGWYREATTHTSTHHDMKNNLHHSVQDILMISLFFFFDNHLILFIKKKTVYL